MSTPEAPVGAHFLVQDVETGEWSLWSRKDKEVCDQLISWSGAVTGDFLQTAAWYRSDDRFITHTIRPENVDSIIMAARHMTTEQWQRFAWRQSERQAL